MPRPKPGMPSPWENVPTGPIRLPIVFHPILSATARLLDSGKLDPDKLLSTITPGAVSLDPSKPPTPEELINLLKGITEAIVLARGWDLTAAEVGYITASLEQSARELDKLFAEKAKAEAIAIAAKKAHKRNLKTQD